MAATSRKSSGPVLRSLSPSGRFCYSSHVPSPMPMPRPSATAFASSTSSFTSRSSTFFHRRPAPPPRYAAASSSAATVRFSIDRPTSPGRSISAVGHSPRTAGQIVRNQIPSQQKRTCMCSPTNHPGSFRCSLHKAAAARGSHAPSSYSPNNRLHARRSAMTNSLVRICGVEGDLVKRALAALIRPSSHQQRRRADFRPRQSRLSVMSKADESCS
ncbi:PREDICTED: uncharacterized protein LOC104808950 [Tarenaya hassleriana]|uniref:uncharacterized protein LOC104808950 n=1 Tax=Tarenaya hassleriana TaxID=28532 RepID=UPI00053C1B80|nr:PREDICTED: uncharacterized protein LOC104808950 [Tarenaya hassleriana]